MLISQGLPLPAGQLSVRCPHRFATLLRELAARRTKVLVRECFWHFVFTAHVWMLFPSTAVMV
jgi:hypothetical protein